MDNRYRTLAAALELGEFTIAALSEEAGVKPVTVRTVLGRSREYFQIERASSQRRGGQPQIWKVRDEARPALKALIGEIGGRFSEQPDTSLELSDGGRLATRDGPPLRAPSANPELATADDLDAYFLQPSIHLLPKLVRQLLVQEPGILQLYIPTGEGILLQGYDGRVESSQASLNVPEGRSVWEFGAGADPRAKAEEDLAKRTKNPDDIDPSTTTFVFVTTRRFRSKAAWAAGHRGEGTWRDIRVIDADDLYAWAQRHPTVHNWLSSAMGLHPAEAVTLETWLGSWLDHTDPPLPAGVLLAGRASQADCVRKAAGRRGELIGVSSTSREESLAFIAAALLEDGQPVLGSPHVSSALLVKTPQEWARLADSLTDGVLVPEFAGAEARAATARGITVLVPLGLAGEHCEAPIDLPRIDLIRASELLVAAGLVREDAERIAGEVDRSLLSFRRTHAVNPDHPRPAWVDASADLVAPLVLLGGWNDEYPADKEVVQELAGRSYDEVDAELSRLALADDPPFFKSGGDWQVASPQDAFNLVGMALTRAALDRWRTAAARVLLAEEPGFTVPTKEELTELAQGIRRGYSLSLRGGIARGAVLLGTFGQPAQVQAADSLVRDLLVGDEDRWVALSSALPTLAEASPDQFLSAAESAIAARRLAGLFSTSRPGSVFGGRDPQTGLLWALELLCRSEAHAPRACYALARLVGLDPEPRTGNNPFDSLRRVLLPWHPQVAASPEERLDILRGMLELHPEVGWRLVLSLLPGLWDSTHPTYTPRFRPWAIPQGITVLERFTSWKAITALAIEAAGLAGPVRLLQLVETIQTLQPDDRVELLRQLASIDVSSWNPDQRVDAWRSVSDLVAKHRQFPSAQWAMPDADLVRLEALLASWAPDDPVAKHQMLFVQYPEISFPRDLDGGTGYDNEVARRKQLALAEILADGGMDAVLRLLVECPEPGSAAWFVAGEIGDELMGSLMPALGEEGSRGRAAVGWLTRMAHERGPDWLAATLVEIADLDAEGRVAAYAALPDRAEVLDVVQQESEAVQQRFWQAASPLLLLRSDRLEEIVAGLIGHRRPRSALGYLSHKVRNVAVSPDLVLQALDETAKTTEPEQLLDAMLPYEVGVLLDFLESSGVPDEDVASREFVYYAVLQHSRASRALAKMLSANPEFFVELVCVVYLADGETQPSDKEYDAAAAARWRTSYALLRDWRTLPGTAADGTIDEEVLFDWFARARETFARGGRAAIGDRCLGELLSGSPTGADGIWPAEPVRRLLERYTSDELREGMEMGKFNARGVTSRGMYEGGRQERLLADEFDAASKRLATRHPNTARMLRDLARSYREMARREDDRDEQWRDSAP